MNKANKAIVVVVLLLVLLFGVGQFFAFGTPPSPAQNGTSSNSTAAAPALPATEVIAYVPPQPASSTPVEKGSCWTSSIAAPFRSDAWRCAVGNGISDPCFEIPGSSSTLLCGVDPAEPASTSTFVLRLTQPLPAAETLSAGTAPSDWAWLVELDDGTLCAPFTGTLPVTAAGEAANYGCAPGPLGDDVDIFGGLNNSSSVWTAEVGTLSASTSSLPAVTDSSTVPVETVWQ